MAVPSSPSAQGIDIFIRPLVDPNDTSKAVGDLKKLNELITEQGKRWDKLSEGMGDPFEKLKKVSAANGLANLTQSFDKIALAQRRALSGLPSTRQDRSLLQRELREMESTYATSMKNINKFFKEGRISAEEYYDELMRVTGAFKQMQQVGQSTLRSMAGSDFFGKLMAGMSISPLKYMALSQALRDMRGSLPTTIRGVSSAAMSLSEGGTLEAEGIGRLAVQRGGGSLSQGRSVLPSLMMGAGSAVDTRTAGQAAATLLQSGWSAEEVAGPLGQAVAAFSKAKGVSADSLMQVADSLRATGMSTADIVKFLGTTGRRHRYGAEAVSGISNALNLAMPYLQQQGIGAGTAAESMSRIQEVMTRGLGMGARGAAISADFIGSLGRQMGDPRAVKELAAYGIHPEAVRAAMSGNITPLLNALQKHRNASPHQIQAMASAFGVDPNSLSAIFSRSGNFKEDGIAGSVNSVTEANRELSESAEKLTNVFERAVNTLASGMSWINSKTGGVLGQLYESDLLGKAAAATYLIGQASRPLGWLGGKALDLGGWAAGGINRGTGGMMGRGAGALGSFGGSVMGGLMGAPAIDPFGLPESFAPVKDPATGKIPATLPQGIPPRRRDWGNTLGKGLRAGGLAVGAGLSAYGAIEGLTKENGNWADRLGGSMQALGTAGLGLSALGTFVPGLGWAAGAGVAAGSGLLSLGGMAVKGIWGADDTQSPVSGVSQGGDQATAVVANNTGILVSEIKSLRTELITAIRSNYRQSAELDRFTTAGTLGTPKV